MKSKTIPCFGVLLVITLKTFSQGYVTVVYDTKNMGAEVVNQGVRLIADNNLNKMLESIENSKKAALENLTIVEQIQKRVYNSLTTVDKTIRQGKNVLDAKNIITDILKYQVEAAEYAQHDPILLLFVEKQGSSFKRRGVDLILYIQNFIMAEGKNVLLDVGKRDRLLSHVMEELRVLRAIAYSAKMQMYWARLDGVFRALNPWQGYINQDISKGQEILNNFKF